MADTHSLGCCEAPISPPKLLVQADLDPNRIPDDVFYKIASFLDVTDRMRLCLLSKRLQGLVHSKPMWSVNIDLLAVSINGEDVGTVTINDHTFGLDKSTAALEMLLLRAAPFTRVHITVAPNCRDLSWIIEFLNRFCDAHPKPVAEMSFCGPPHSAPVVFERLLAKDGTEQRVDIYLCREQLDRLPPHGYAWFPGDNHASSIGERTNAVWMQLALCPGLTSLRIASQFGETYREAEGHPPLHIYLPVDRIAAVVNNCPALSQLHCGGLSYFFILDLLSDGTLSRLQHFDIFLEKEWSAPTYLLSLPSKLPSLTRSVITLDANVRFTVFIPLVKSFLNAWYLEGSTKLIYLDFQWLSKGPIAHPPTFFSALNRFCDSIIMLGEGRIGFVKGSAIVASKFRPID